MPKNTGNSSSASSRGSELGEETIQNIIQMRRVPDLNTFRVDVVNGMAANLERGALGLVPVARLSVNRPTVNKGHGHKL